MPASNPFPYSNSVYGIRHFQFVSHFVLPAVHLRLKFRLGIELTPCAQYRLRTVIRIHVSGSTKTYMVAFTFAPN